MNKILTACATRGSKPNGANQDACANSARAVVVADGLGSFFKSEVASAFAAKALNSRLTEADDTQLSQRDWFKRAFREVQQELAASPEADLASVPDTHDKKQAFGTTLLCVAAHDDLLTMAYVGNGAMLHLRAGFDEFPGMYVLPWSAQNYLNPHNVPENGKSAMTRLIAPGLANEWVVPTVLQLQQDLRGPGDIIVVCSDGIYSADEVQVGRDSEGNIWQSGNQTLVILYEMLGEFLRKAEPTSSDLKHTLELYLDRLSQAKLIEDDCTLGVLVTPAALAYYATKYNAGQQPDVAAAVAMATEQPVSDGAA